MKRIYLLTGDKATQTPFVCCPDSEKIYKYPITSNTPIGKSEIIKNNLYFINKNQNSMIQTIRSAEDTQGNPNLFRSEQTSESAERKLIEFIFTNLHATESKEFVLGDHHGLIADQLQLPQLDAALMVDGTYGAVGLAVFKQITGANPFRLHGFHITSNTITLSATANGQPVNFTGLTPNLPTYTVANADNAFFTLGFLKNADIDPLGEMITNPKIKLADLYSDKSFNKEIRQQPNFRKIVDGFSGIHFKIPPKTQIAFNVSLAAIHRSYNMVKV